MPDFHWIDPSFQSAARRLRWDDLDALLAWSGGAVELGDRSGCDQVRATIQEERGENRSVVIYRERNRRIKDLLVPRLTRWSHVTSLRGQCDLLQQLAFLDVEAERPLVCLESGWWPARGGLVLEEPSGYRPLPSLLAEGPTDAAWREGMFTALATEVARLHWLEIDQPELYASAVLVREEAGRWRFAFLRMRTARRGHVRLVRRAEGLAALWATLPRRLVEPRDHELFLDAYLRAGEYEDRGIELESTIQRATERLLGQRRIWEIRESADVSVPEVPELESLEGGKMWVDRGYRPALEAAGLVRFEDVMATDGGQCLRRLPLRENWRLEVHDRHEGPRGMYLKKHHIRTWNSRWRALVGAGPGRTAGRVEARNVARLSRSGIAAMRLVAYGEKLHQDGLLESFVLTEELVGYQQLDHFLRSRFPAPTIKRDPALQQLITDVAEIAARFHRQGYNHRDLYCCHFFIKEPAPGNFLVNLIDLQRVERRRRFRQRWLVKDLAQLAYSAPRDRVSGTQKLRFIKRYLGVTKLRPQDKTLIRKILKKQRWMEWMRGLHP